LQLYAAAVLRSPSRREWPALAQAIRLLPLLLGIHQHQPDPVDTLGLLNSTGGA